METQFANIKTTQSENLALFTALEKANEAYGDARRRINEEGEYANWEDSEQMDAALADHAKDIAAAYENEIREAAPSDVKQLLENVDAIYYYSKEKLESEVPAEHKQEIGW